MMSNSYLTSRLRLNKLQPDDNAFILELVNTPGWIQFIGERNVKSLADADQYIHMIMNDASINYWVVKLKDDAIPLGVVTLIKKEYLDHPDLGFAFLPHYTKQGFAYEAAQEVLNDALKQGHEFVLATTLKENDNSIRLLEKLGFEYEKEIDTAHSSLSVYKVKGN